jgi:hypothetical protein
MGAIVVERSSPAAARGSRVASRDRTVYVAVVRFFPIALLFLACGCTDKVPLRSGDYVSDDLNEPKALSGVVLTVDLGHATATLVDGSDRVTLRMERVADPEAWIHDCVTMTGANTLLEIARLSPASFTIRGQHFSYDILQADCGGPGTGVRLTRSTGADERWIFRPR